MLSPYEDIPASSFRLEARAVPAPNVGFCSIAVPDIIFEESKECGWRACRLPKCVLPAWSVSRCHSSNLGQSEGPKWNLADVSDRLEPMSRAVLPHQLKRHHMHSCQFLYPSRKFAIER